MKPLVKSIAAREEERSTVRSFRDMQDIGMDILVFGISLRLPVEKVIVSPTRFFKQEGQTRTTRSRLPYRFNSLIGCSFIGSW